jgi:ketosteroid isomerase-like protein
MDARSHPDECVGVRDDFRDWFVLGATAFTIPYMNGWVLLLLAATLAGLQTPAETTRAAERATAEVEQRFNQAVEKHDRAELENFLADPFTWIHALDGRVESRSMFIASVLNGQALARQRADSSTTFDRVVALYGDTAIATARVRTRFPGGTRETWVRQSRVYVRDGRGWKLALGHGTALYDGPPTTSELYGRYAGTYVMADGRTLRLEWDGDSLMATLPNGPRTQIFLKSPTEEVTALPEHFAFTLDAAGRPTIVRSMRGSMEVWRAERKQ